MRYGSGSGRLFPARPSLVRNVLWIACIALIYFVVARFSLSLVFQPEGIAAIWPPTGIFLSALLLTRRDLRPWLAGTLFITDFIAETLAGTPVAVSLLYALILTGDAVFSSWLLLRFVGECITFRRVREVVGWLLLSVILSNALASLAAATAAQLLPETSFWVSWKEWMASEGVGNLIVTPFVLSWATWGKTRSRVWNPNRVLEGAAMCLLLALLGYLAFDRLSVYGPFSLLLTYLAFSFLLWAALRFAMRGAASASLVLAAITVYYAPTGRVIAVLSPGSPLDIVITVQLYVAIMAAPALILAGVVTERKQAEIALRNVNRLYATLSEVNQTIVRVKERDELFKAVCRIAVDFGQFRMAWIGLIDAQSSRLQPVIHAGHEDGYLQAIKISTSQDSPLGRGPSGLSLQTGRVVTSNDIQADPEMSPWREAALRRGYRSAAAVPFRLKGVVIGALALYAAEPGFFSAEEQTLLNEIGTDISFALDTMAAQGERKRAQEALATRAYQQSVIAELGSLALSATGLQTLFDRTTVRVADALRVEYCTVLELLPDGSALKLVAGVGWTPGLVGVATVSAARESQAGFTLLTNEPVIVEDLRTETRFNHPSILLDHGVVSGISVVILSPERPFGALTAHTTQRRAFAVDDVHFLHAVANLLAEGIQRRCGESALTAERSLLRTLVDHLPDAIYVKDVAGRKTLANPTDVRNARVASEAEMLGKTDFDLFPPDLAAAFTADDQHVLETGEPVLNRQEQITLPDGSLGWQLTSKVPLRDSARHVIGLVGIGHEITERVRAEVERERLLAQLQAQAQQIAQIMDSVPEGVLLLDADGRVLLANPAGARDLATLAGAAVGERLIHLGALPVAGLLTTAEHGTPWHEIRFGGRIFEAIARPVVAGQAGTGGPGDRRPVAEQRVLVINDVTAARNLRDQLQQQERLAAVGQLAAGIAHDFNNILAIIALNAPRVAQAPGLAQRDRERLAVIVEQTNHATRLVQQLLDFSRRAVLERQPLDLGPLLREQVKLLARTLPETIAVTLACEPGEHVVLADPTRLRQMLMNLAVNARDAMPAGGVLRLALARQATAPRPDLPDGSWVRLEVADSGMGIAPEAQAHLFEPFFTTKPPGQGTGLGLAQVHGIVKQHDGEIAVRSAAGEGTTISIFLPVVAQTAPPPVAAAAAPQAGAEQMILIVEDNAMLLDAMCDTVQALGYRVLGAGNGAEALAVLAEHGDTIAVVLSDLVMPVMGGEALFRAMRERGLTLPVVMLSGHPSERELAGLKAQGLAGWLLKPPKPDDLARLLAQAIADS